jgi:hypothetical protein
MPPANAFVFVAGGTVQAGGGVYLERAADRDVLEHCRAGDFTYILTSRQMGKSSLMIRTAERLTGEKLLPVIVDLTELGTQTTPEQWYKGFLFAVQEQLGLGVDASRWWNDQPDHSFALRFTRYLREVALVERHERIVLFVDEIDTTLRLDFTDDFFAAIRFLYQNRAADPELARLSFVLIGVATPGDLIKDGARTPFNVGHRVELTDFTDEEAEPLIQHLDVPPALARSLIRWITAWTGGHPYLTLRVVRSLAESPPARLSRNDIDARVSELFLGQQGEFDSNLRFVRDMLTKKAFDREAVLRTYTDIRCGKSVPDNELDQVQSWLKLSGVVRRSRGILHLRNVVYETVFDEAWARQHLRLHLNWRRRLTHAVAGLLVLTTLVTIPLAIYAWQQKANAEARLHEAEAELVTRIKNLESGQRPPGDVKDGVPGYSNQLDVLREEAKRVLAESKQLALDRDDALRRAKDSEQRIANLRLDNARLADRLGHIQADIVMPNLAGVSVGAAKRTLERLTLVVGRTFPQSSTAAKDTVIGQWPQPNAKLTRGSSIDLLISDGTGRASVDQREEIKAATDATGRFAKKLSAGSYDVRFEASGAATIVYQRVPVTPTTIVKLNVTLRSARDANTVTIKDDYKPVRGASSIEGSVVDAAGQAVSNVAITFVKK